MKFWTIFMLISSFALASCGNNDPVDEDGTNSEIVNEQEDGDTTALSEAELFSLILVNDVLQGTEENDLQLYLEEEIYPIVGKASKVTLDRLSASVYIVTYELNGERKSLLIQKFYDPVNEVIVFEKTETSYGLKSQYVR